MPVNNSVVYEDEDIVVFRAPSDEELEKLVKELIAKKLSLIHI